MRNKDPFKKLKMIFRGPRSNQWHQLMSPFEPNNFCLKHFFLLSFVFEILESWIIWDQMGHPVYTHIHTRARAYICI